MHRRNTAIQRGARNAGSDIALQDVIDGLLDCLEDELLIIDSEHRVRFANSVVRSKLHKDVEPPIGRLCYEVFYDRNVPCSAPLWHCPLREVLQSGSMITAIHPDHISGDGRYFKITAYPIWDGSGNIEAIVELRRDVTAERKLETQILKRHHQLLALSRISTAVSGLQDLDTILRIALDNVLELVNGVIGGILLIDIETQTLSYRVYHGLSAQTAEKVRLRLGEGIAGTVAHSGKSILLEDISTDPRAAYPDVVRKEGLKAFISVPLRSKETVLGVINVASHAVGQFGEDDIYLLNSIGDYLGTAIEQAKLYEQLVESRDRYHALLQYALSAQEDERRRIARELHDETSQALTSLTLNLQAIIGIAEMKGFGDAEFSEKLRKVHEYTVQAGNEVVNLMKELRPTVLDELGLPAAIHRYAKDTLQTHDITISSEFRGTDERFQPEVEVTLFRIAQGIIGNILKHSEAKNTFIKLECNAGECMLHIKDDGKGFDTSKRTRVDASGRGTGLYTIEERASLVGGSCHIESSPGNGTKIMVKVPLTRNNADEKDKRPYS